MAMDIFYENILSDSSPSAIPRHHLSSCERRLCCKLLCKSVKWVYYNLHFASLEAAAAGQQKVEI